MKKNLLKMTVACLAGILILSCCTSVHRTNVTVVFRHAGQEQAKVCMPPCDYSYFVTDTLYALQNDSVYCFHADIERPEFMYLQIDGKSNLILLLQPGQDFSIEYDFTKELPYTFTGENAEGQLLLNQWMQQVNPYKYEFIRNWDVAPLDSVPERMEANFEKMKQNDIAPFDSLYHLGKIDRAFRDLMAAHIEVFYLNHLSRIARNGSRTDFGEAYFRYWEELYKRFPLGKTERRSPFFFNYADEYIMNFLPAKQKKEGKEIAPPKDKAEYYQLIYRLCHEWTADKKLIEITCGYELNFYALNNKNNSPDIIPCFEKFRQEFPDNVLNKVFDNYIRVINRYQQVIKEDFPEGVRFLEGSAQMKSLEDVFAALKGKPIFVDFWFSTCGPCREQFAYAKPLEEFLRAHGVEMLFISIDPDAMDKDWKDSIKFFQLAGWHIRVPSSVQKDMFDNYGLYSYPTYMLVGEDGHILIERAKQPSEKDALYQQIEEVLKQTE